MRTLFRFITLLLCVELVIGPMAPEFQFLMSKAHAQESCPSGLTYNSSLNRCLTSVQTAKVMQATSSCAPDDAGCYRKNAENAMAGEVSKGNVSETEDGFSSGWAKAANIAAIAGPLSMAVAGLANIKSDKCQAISFYAITAASISLLVGDNLANYKHKKRLKDIERDWGRIVNPEHAGGDKDKEREASIDAQGEAFEMLARAEDSLAKAAKMKKTYLTVASLSYTAAGIMAGLEAMDVKNIKSKYCEVKEDAKTDSQQPTVGEQKTDISEQQDTSNQKQFGNKNPYAKYKVPAATGGAEVLSSPDSSEANLPKEEPPKNQIKDKNSSINFTQSLFEAYASSTPSIIWNQEQFVYNIKNSTDIESLVANQMAFEKNYSSPSIDEYETIKKNMAVIEKDETVLEVFKMVTLSILGELSPIQTAYAQNDQIMSQTNSASSQNQNKSKNTKTTVNTNAAKTFKKVTADDNDMLLLTALGVAGYGATKLIDDDTKTAISDKMLEPYSRLAFSGVMAVMTQKMASHAGDQEKKSKERAAFLRKMKKDFEDTSNALYACKSDDRKDPAKPNCYCYTPDNQRNTQRENSQVCQNLWAGKSLNATQYNLNAADQKVCINKQQQADPNCVCRQNNSCMKVSMSGLKGVTPGTLSMLNSAVDPLNKLSNGSTDAGSIDVGALQNQAARLTAAVKKLEEHPEIKKNAAKKKKAGLEISNQLNKAAASLPASSLLGNTSSGGMPSNPGEAARMLEKELKAADAPTAVAGSSETIGTPQSPGEELEFGLSTDDLAVQESQIAEVMKQDLDYGANDINEGSKTNIFEVLSNRYQRSGMRRLFDEKGTTAAEAPAKEDIHQ